MRQADVETLLKTRTRLMWPAAPSLCPGMTRMSWVHRGNAAGVGAGGPVVRGADGLGEGLGVDGVALCVADAVATLGDGAVVLEVVLPHAVAATRVRAAVATPPRRTDRWVTWQLRS